MDFRFFCEAYFSLTCHLPWSADHLKVIARIEQAVLHGELFQQLGSRLPAQLLATKAQIEAKLK